MARPASKEKTESGSLIPDWHGKLQRKGGRLLTPLYGVRALIRDLIIFFELLSLELTDDAERSLLPRFPPFQEDLRG